jgi:hypothetical protein
MSDRAFDGPAIDTYPINPNRYVRNRSIYNRRPREGCAHERHRVRPMPPREAGRLARLNDIKLLSFDFPGRTTNKCGRPAQAPPILRGSSRLGGSLEPPWSGN